MESPIIKQVKGLLGQGDLDEAIKLLSTYSESNLKGSNANKVKNEIIHLQGQIAEVKHAQNRGLIAFEEAERKQNRIRGSMLNLTDVVAGVDGANLEVPTGTAQPTPPSDSNNIYKYIVIGVGAIILFVIAITMFDDESAGTEQAQPDSISADIPATTIEGTDEQCYFETFEAVNVYAEADYLAVIVGSLPAEIQANILDSKVVVDDEGEAVMYFLIAQSNLNGWVEYDDTIEISPACE